MYNKLVRLERYGSLEIVPVKLKNNFKRRGH